MNYLKDKKILAAIILTLLFAFIAFKFWTKHKDTEAQNSPEGQAIKNAVDAYNSNKALYDSALNSGDSAGSSAAASKMSKALLDSNQAIKNFSAKYPNATIPYL